MTYKVAMHCTDKEPIEVNNLATSVITGLTTNASTFVTTTMPLTAITTLIGTLTTANNKLSGYIAGAAGNHNITTLRNSQTVVVYDLLNTSLRSVVEGGAGGVKAIIELSGFDATSDKVVRGIPDVPVISKISDKNKAPGTAKVLLVKHSKKTLAGAAASKASRGLKYSAQTTAAPATATSVWENNVESVSSRDLLLTGLVKANEVAVRIRAEDGKLKSAWSASVEYMSHTTASGIPTTTPVTPTTTPTTGTTPASGA